MTPRERERSRWNGMLRRCENQADPAYPGYGGRGINVCERWHDFDVFYADIAEALGPCPSGKSLDRIDNNGNYEPGNVRWASQLQQANNTRPVAAMYAAYARYCELRDSGLRPSDAAREADISYDKAIRYERSYQKLPGKVRHRSGFDLEFRGMA